MLLFESQCSPRAWEGKGGRDSDQTEQAEFQPGAGAEGAAVVICVYAECQGMSSMGPSRWLALGFPHPHAQCLGHVLLEHSPGSSVIEYLVPH